jgi:hypothetical protein
VNVKLSHDVSFSAVVVEGARIFPNSYKLKIDMLTLTENAVHQNVAIQRILAFIKDILNGSVFCHIKNPNASKIARLAKDSRVILFPEEPYDQIIGMILLNKLHAIVEETLEIDSIQISSNIAPDLTYTVDDFETFEFDNEKIELPWWDRFDPTTTDNSRKLKKAETWSDYNLGWEAKTNAEIELDFILEMNDNDKQPDVVVLDGGPDAEN